MENLFQATLERVLETARSISSIDESLGGREILDLESDLPREKRKRLAELGILPVRKGQLLNVQNGYFSHKGFLSNTLRDLTRLGLIHYGLLKGLENSFSSWGRDEFPCESEGANLFIVGQAPSGHLSAFPARKPRIRLGGKGSIYGCKGFKLRVTDKKGADSLPAFVDVMVEP